MTAPFGLLAAFLAFLAWGFGDFSIQRAVRAIGNVQALFFIGALGSIVLLPFAWGDLPRAVGDPRTISLFVGAVCITFLAALLDFQGLKEGKISVIEPVMSFELIITMAIGMLILHERVSGVQFALALAVFAGILLTVLHREPRHWWTFWRRRHWLERGVLFAAFGAIAMALTNILTGMTSQATTPVVAIWVIHTSLALISLLVFFTSRSVRATFALARVNWKPVLAESVFDNIAWLSYSFAVTAFPISITIAITESYIALAALLGIVWNKERVHAHQYLGILIAIVGAVLLATTLE
jgi:drug/metabolite transporter (DMT)-like permease